MSRRPAVSRPLAAAAAESQRSQTPKSRTRLEHQHSQSQPSVWASVWAQFVPLLQSLHRRNAHCNRKGGHTMELGAFSISLAVKDIQASKSFYEKFGFKVLAGDASQNWLILKNGDHAIGLFQGMFEKNILTFNPGWDGNAQPLASFTACRELHRQVKAQGA